MTCFSRREEEAGVQMRARLMSGKDTSLIREKKMQNCVFPPEVVSTARVHWEHITLTEPNPHKRFGPSSAMVKV